MRYFISIDVENEEVEDNLVNFINSVKGLGRIKPVSRENLHLTLLFLGKRAEDEEDEIVNRFDEVMDDINEGEIECSVSGLGVFPHMNFIKVVWAGVKLEEKLKDIHVKFNEVLEGENEHDFVPHITLARVKDIRGDEKRRLKEAIREHPADFGGFKAENVRLKQSELTEEGPVYRDVRVREL